MADSRSAKQGKKGAELYLDFLAEEGFRPRINADGDVAFKYEGKNYFIDIDEKDEMYFRLVYPDFWSIESDEELAQVKETALAVTADYKVIKIYPVENTDTWAAIELFCSPPESFKLVFYRCIRTLRAGVKAFVAKMQEPPAEPDAFVFHLPRYNLGNN